MHGNNWVQGSCYSSKMKFHAGSMVEINPFVTCMYFHQGASCISDTNGFLRLICDGYRLWDSLGNPIDGGDTITPSAICNQQDGWSLYSQSSIILPVGNDEYMVLVSTVSDSLFYNLWPVSLTDPFDILSYTLVDMKQNGGYGKVIEKAVPLLNGPWLAMGGMMACRHADGKSWWLLKQAKVENKVYKFVITRDSIYDYGFQSFPEPLYGNGDGYGQMTFSPDGKEYVWLNASRNLIFRANFDRCSGNISNPRIYNIPIHDRAPGVAWADTFMSGACYSPNGRFLYVNAWYNLYQLDLDEPDSSLAWYHVANMDTTYDQFQNWTVQYMGPDGKIYLGHRNGFSTAFSYIANPDVKGAGCNFCPKCLQFPLPAGVNTPPCMPNYALGKDTTLNCWPMGLSESEESAAAEKEWVVYPNPAQTQLSIESEAFKNGLNSLRIFNLMGQCVLEEEFKTASGKHTVSVQGLPAGVYVVRVNGGVRRVLKE